MNTISLMSQNLNSLATFYLTLEFKLLTILFQNNAVNPCFEVFIYLLIKTKKSSPKPLMLLLNSFQIQEWDGDSRIEGNNLEC